MTLLERLDCTPIFTKFANVTSRLAGRALTFVICLLLIVAWGVTGPMFHYSDTWQLVINTSTTIITFLMVFLIQNTQNRDNAALQAKLDELIRVSKAKNDFIGIEHLSDHELEEILAECEKHRPNLLHRAEVRADRARSVKARKASHAEAKSPQRTASARRAKVA
jgi:low affinity Fe/Cu permease